MSKLDHYVPINDTKLVFGMLVKLESITGNFREMHKHAKVLQANPSINGYFFQFFVPNDIFFVERDQAETSGSNEHIPYSNYLQNYYFTKETNKPFIQFPVTANPTKFSFHKVTSKKSNTHFRNPIEITSKHNNTFKGRTNIIVKSVDNMVVNNNVQYAFPTFFNVQQPLYPPEQFNYSPFIQPIQTYPPTPYTNPTFDSIQRLKLLIGPTVPALETAETLLSEFMARTTPKFKAEINESSLISIIWDFYKNIEIELFKREPSGKPKMAIYAVSLIGISMTIHSVPNGKVMNYVETKPYYQRLPLFDKIKELSENYPELLTVKLCDIEEKSWFGVMWVQANCTPQLQVLAQFSIYYKFSKELGCKQVGMWCDKLIECEFWKDIRVDKKSMEIIKEEESKLRHSGIPHVI